MDLEAKTLNGRVYFGTFDKDNDVDPRTKRGGLNFFRFNLIGWLLHKLGFAHKVHYTEKEKHGVRYLYPKSFTAWKDRHKTDAGLNIEALNQALFQKDFEKAIKIIYENFALHIKVNNKQKTANPIEAIQQVPILPQMKNSQVPAIAFGKKQWAELGLEVKDYPLPENIDEILKKPCPYSNNGETVEQSYVLVQKPESINGEAINGDNFVKFMQSKFPELGLTGNGSNTEDAKKLKGNDKPCWLLMKKEIFGSKKSFVELQQMINELGHGKYQIPDALDVIICAMAEYARSETNLFNDLKTLTFCQDKSEFGNQMVVGRWHVAPNHLYVSKITPKTFANEHYGITPLRKF